MRDGMSDSCRENRLLRDRRKKDAILVAAVVEVLPFALFWCADDALGHSDVLSVFGLVGFQHPRVVCMELDFDTQC